MNSSEFPRSWQADQLGASGLQGADRRFSTVDTSSSDTPQLAVSFMPKTGSSWVGAFEGITRLPEAQHDVYSHPNLDSALIVAGGQGYVVKVDAPSEWYPIEEAPIVSVAEILSLNFIVLADLIHVMAYGPDGPVWRSERLAYDGIRITHADDEAIRGFAWSAPDNGEVPFAVDPLTGKVTGGAAP